MYIYRVYRNLNGGDLSIMNMKTRLVVAHAEWVTLESVEFVVSPSGKKRALETGQRNVHAFVQGQVVNIGGLTPYKGREFRWNESFFFGSENPERVKYDPFSEKGFYLVDTGEEVTRAAFAMVLRAGTIAACNAV